MVDRYQTFPINCVGGLIQDVDSVLLGNQFPGAATTLVNYEPSIGGGYQSIKGYIPFDEDPVPGTGKILGLKVAFNGVIAARGDNVYFSSGSGWGSPINTAARTNGGRYRFIDYELNGQFIAMCDGVNPAAKWDGTTYTLLNGTGAPSSPLFAEYHYGRLVLATENELILSSPISDTNFEAINGAIAIRVNDAITGIKRFRDILYIFCRNSIQKLVGSSSASFQILSVTDKIGCIAPDSIQEIGGDVIYLSVDGVRSLAGTERNDDIALSSVSRNIQKLITDYVNTSGRDSYSSCVVFSKSQYRLFSDTGVNDDGAFNFLGALRADTNLQFEWAQTLGFNACAADSAFTALQNELIVFANPIDHTVYRLEQGGSRNGEEILSIYTTPILTFGEANIRKRFQKLKIFFRLTGNAEIVVKATLNCNEATKLQPSAREIDVQTNIILYGGGSTYGDGSTYSDFRRVYCRMLSLNGTGQDIQITLSQSSTGLPHQIDSLQIEFKPDNRR